MGGACGASRIWALIWSRNDNEQPNVRENVGGRTKEEGGLEWKVRKRSCVWPRWNIGSVGILFVLCSRPINKLSTVTVGFGVWGVDQLGGCPTGIGEVVGTWNRLEEGPNHVPIWRPLTAATLRSCTDRVFYFPRKSSNSEGNQI
ncbi:unnamed protein product [Bursaphelenchus xylophilus]|uniref:(pine wood nematode) hypothetical protein n=1 Tax=Bursaphelenchus xylophilus TaxID=6326 RepID=A0A1I7SKV1_BURXY|nr:unnamed protein product [Bursaphelenchus xylophilus]CAG9104126.1 unnamed protein product [Bursaphelenchus xylophilus]